MTQRQIDLMRQIDELYRRRIRVWRAPGPALRALAVGERVMCFGELGNVIGVDGNTIGISFDCGAIVRTHRANVKRSHEEQRAAISHGGMTTT